jgi:hypothetical protein
VCELCVCLCVWRPLALASLLGWLIELVPRADAGQDPHFEQQHKELFVIKLLSNHILYELVISNFQVRWYSENLLLTFVDEHLLAAWLKTEIMSCVSMCTTWFTSRWASKQPLLVWGGSLYNISTFLPGLVHFCIVILHNASQIDRAEMFYCHSIFFSRDFSPGICDM